MNGGTAMSRGKLSGVHFKTKQKIELPNILVPLFHYTSKTLWVVDVSINGRSWPLSMPANDFFVMPDTSAKLKNKTVKAVQLNNLVDWNRPKLIELHLPWNKGILNSTQFLFHYSQCPVLSLLIGSFSLTETISLIKPTFRKFFTVSQYRFKFHGR